MLLLFLALWLARRDIISNKSKAAAGLCDWAINIVKYYDVVSEVEPKRLELAGANDKLAAANTTLKQVQDKVALLNAQVQELEDQYNKVGHTRIHCLAFLPLGHEES